MARSNREKLKVIEARHVDAVTKMHASRKAGDDTQFIIDRARADAFAEVVRLLKFDKD